MRSEHSLRPHTAAAPQSLTHRLGGIVAAWPLTTNAHRFSRERGTLFLEFLSVYRSKRLLLLPATLRLYVWWLFSAVAALSRAWFACQTLRAYIDAKLAQLLAWPPVCFARSWCVGDVVRLVLR